mgnify:CR=1 FL=1
MKIGIVLSNTPAYSETFFNAKIRGLIKNGFEVEIFVEKKDNSFSLCDVKVAPSIYKRNLVKLFLSVFVTYLKLLFYLPKVFRFAKLEREVGLSYFVILKKVYLNAHILRAKNIDWLHFGFGTVVLGREHLGKVIGAKLAVSFRGFDIGIYPLKQPNCYNLLWTCVDKVHVISEDILNLAYKEGMTKNILTEKITPAINAEFFKASSTVNQIENREKINFLSVGRLHWKKGYGDTLQALKILKDQGIDFNYVIIGDGKEYERIAFEVYQYGLFDNVEFKGKLTQSEIIDHMNQSDIYIQYSIQEGFCNAVLEAQSMGLLCLVSDAEGLSENVLNGKTGWVIPKSNPLLLAAKIVEVLELSENEKNTIKKNASLRVKKEFSIEKQEQEFVNFYKD